MLHRCYSKQNKSIYILNHGDDKLLFIILLRITTQILISFPNIYFNFYLSQICFLGICMCICQK